MSCEPPDPQGVWNLGGGDQATWRIVRYIDSHLDELAAKEDWCHNLVDAAVSVKVMLWDVPEGDQAAADSGWLGFLSLACQSKHWN